MRGKKINTTSFFLLIGIFGDLIMILSRIIFDIAKGEFYLKYFGPETFSSILSVISIFVGFIGFVMFIINLFQKSKSKYKMVNSFLVASNFILLLIVSFLYASI